MTFRKVFVANRGEIAVRIVRTLREMGITSAVGYSEADRQALFVLEADEAYLLGPAAPAESYLSAEALVRTALAAGADAVHPGYGFLSENAAFVDAVESAGLTFIGPSPHAIRVMGDKIAARQAAGNLGVPLVPGSPEPVKSVAAGRAIARELGFPLAVKAAGGGGGRGIRIVRAEDELEASLEAAGREAERYFKNPDIYLERYFPVARHVEIQVLGDRRGCLIHLGERDCSLQRRHQKLIEESPSPAVDATLRTRMGEMALRVAGAVDYTSAGTVEFLLAPEGDFYFLEMNTRIQVEHPVTEAVTGLDLVREMVLVAAGEHLSRRESVERLHGHAIEVRINAEDPLAGFQPTPAPISTYREPGGPGTRVDSGVYPGFTVPGDYDSLLAKLICWAPDRESARRRTLRALHEYVIEGPRTTIPFDRAALSHPAFVAGEVSTSFLAERGHEVEAALHHPPDRPKLETGARDGDPRVFDVEVDRRLYRVRVIELQSAVDGRKAARSAAGAPRGARGGPELASPMHGQVIAVRKQLGEQVQAGDTIFLIEAMKMENEVRAHRAGTIAALLAEPGDTVEAEQPLARIE